MKEASNLQNLELIFNKLNKERATNNKCFEEFLESKKKNA